MDRDVRASVVMSIDVEWAHPEVLADVVTLLDEHAILATFFCTHAGIEVPGHERALHPNFRRSDNSVFSEGPGETFSSDRSFYRAVVSATRAFCTEAIGVRAHSLFYDSDLLPVYREAGLEYDSSYMLPLAPALAPVWKGAGLLELPVYYMDHWDLREQATGFDLTGLHLKRPGLKVVTFHPNLIYLNAATERNYTDSKPGYDDPDWLRVRRNPSRGIRTLFIELLEWVARNQASVVLADVNTRWRASHARPAALIARSDG